MLVRMENRTAHFGGDSSLDNIDAIIFCTGYRHSYPFMARRFRLQAGVTDLIPANLSKSIFWIDQPYVAYLGALRQLYSFTMFDIQAALVRDVFLDHIQLPNINEWQKREEAMMGLQTDYLHDLLTLSDRSNSFIKEFFSLKFKI